MKHGFFILCLGLLSAVSSQAQSMMPSPLFGGSHVAETNPYEWSNGINSVRDQCFQCATE